METALICVALGTALGGATAAECLAAPPPCQSLAESAIVAVVDVVEAAEAWERVGDIFKPVPQKVRLRVIERFKGVTPEQREITGSIHHEGETVFLALGRRYLLYVYEDRAGTWITSCSRTTLAQTAATDLRQLRRCAKK